MDKRLIGKLGEKLACKWYADRKYTLLTMNYRTRFGEVDIVAQYRNTVVFIEVKTRETDKFLSAREAVSYHKQKRIKAAAVEFIRKKGYDDYNVRFDVAEVYHPQNNPQINIIENAFE